MPSAEVFKVMFLLILLNVIVGETADICDKECGENEQEPTCGFDCDKSCHVKFRRECDLHYLNCVTGITRYNVDPPSHCDNLMSLCSNMPVYPPALTDNKQGNLNK